MPHSRGTIQQCIGLLRDDPALRSRLANELSALAGELHTAAPDLALELGLVNTESKSDALTDRRIAVALATFLGAIGTGLQPLLLLFDDMQWADDLTLLILECWHLVQAKHVLLLVGMRPSESTSERLRENVRSSVIVTLDPLRREDQNQLLCSMAGELPSQILDTIWTMASGNPFVASALLRGLVEDAVLSPSASGWVVDEGKLRHVQMSGQAAEVLKQRLVRLSPESQSLLAVGAVLGKDFSLEMAAELAEIPRTRVLELLEELVETILSGNRPLGRSVHLCMIRFVTLF